MHRLFLIAAAATLSLALPAAAQDPVSPAEVDLGAAQMGLIQRDPDKALQSFYTQAFAAAPDGIVTRDLIDGLANLTLSTRRGSIVGDYLAYDLDGDGVISAAEQARLIVLLPMDRRAMFLVRVQSADTDGDGAVSMAEILRAAAQDAAPAEPQTGRSMAIQRGMIRYGYSRDIRTQQLETLMKMDLDGDGRVTPAEIREVVMAIAHPGAAIGQKTP